MNYLEFMYLFRNILRILFSLSCLCLMIFFILKGCGGLSEDEEGFRSREPRDRADRENGDDDSGDGFREDPSNPGFTDTDSEFVDSDAGPPPYTQKILSDKIDFLFILDTSSANKHYIEKSVMQKKMGSFIQKLNEEEIDWRIYTTCGHTNAKQPLYDGRLHELEYNGTIIPFLHLDNHVLSADNARDPVAYASAVFIDTISHPRRRNCDMPPYCYKNRYNRPLKALSGFLKTASRSKHKILREGADLIIVIISNQDEKPSLYKPKVPHKAVHVQEQLRTDFPDRTWHAITFGVRAIDSGCTDGKIASEIPQIARLTNGLNVNICSHAYAQTIIDFIREKQYKEVRRQTMQEVQNESSNSGKNIRNDIYGTLQRR